MMKPKALPLLALCLDNGIQLGIRRAFKHEECPLSEEQIQRMIDNIHGCIETELFEWFDMEIERE